MVFTQQQIADMKNEFITLLKSTNRPGIDQLLDWLEKSDFYRAPSSVKFHNCIEGGLLNHSLNVYHAAHFLLEQAKKVAVPEKKFNEIPEESVIIAALLHDLCKTNFYYPVQKVWKDESKPSPACWRKYMSYEIRDSFPLGHGEKTVIMVQNFIRLTGQEICAIRWHMGLSDAGAALSPYEKPALMSSLNDVPLVPLIMEADHFASFIMEREVNQKIECEVF